MSEPSDILDSFDYVWLRFTNRMKGLTDAEWVWHPLRDQQIGLEWRLGHVASLLSVERNTTWLGIGAVLPPLPEFDPETSAIASSTAAGALEIAEIAFHWWRDQVAALDVAALDEPMGEIAGFLSTSTKRAFVLHILDELIHHTAEAALLRDLYAGRPD